MNAPRHIHQTEGNRRQTEENRRQSDDNKRQSEDNQRTPGPIEVRLTPDTIRYLDQRIAEAVTLGIKNALTEENARSFWAAGVNVFKEQAEEHTGRLVIGGLKGLMSKLFLFLVLGSIVYALGGWVALGKLWATLFNVAP